MACKVRLDGALAEVSQLERTIWKLEEIRKKEQEEEAREDYSRTQSPLQHPSQTPEFKIKIRTPSSLGSNRGGGSPSLPAYTPKVTQHSPSKQEHDYRKHLITKSRRKEERKAEAEAESRSRTPQDDNLRVRGFLSHNTPDYKLTSPFTTWGPEDKVRAQRDAEDRLERHGIMGGRVISPDEAHEQASLEYQERLEKYASKDQVRSDMDREHEKSVLKQALTQLERADAPLTVISHLRAQEIPSINPVKQAVEPVVTAAPTIPKAAAGLNDPYPSTPGFDEGWLAIQKEKNPESHLRTSPGYFREPSGSRDLLLENARNLLEKAPRVVGERDDKSPECAFRSEDYEGDRLALDENRRGRERWASLII